jgi:hypothetical protein
MRCGNHANIDLDGFRSAHSLEATFLYDTQEFDPGLRAELTDLVEKKRPPFARSKRPRLRSDAPVKAPSSWPNSF